MFTLATLVFQIEIDGDICDPLALFRFKELFRHTFHLSAARSGDMDGYRVVFSQSLTPDPSALKRFQKPPLPFAFRLPVLPCGGVGPHSCELTLSLAGVAINHLGSFITAVDDTLLLIASEFRFDATITSLSSLGPDRTRYPLINDSSQLALISSQDLSLHISENADELSLTILSPLHLMHEGRTLNRLDFSSFIRPLMRRVSSLAYYYSGVELEMDFRALSVQSGDVSTVVARLEKERWGMIGSGLVGEVVFRGPLQHYLPFVLIGEQFNLGKSASYGMGAFVPRFSRL